MTLEQFLESMQSSTCVVGLETVLVNPASREEPMESLFDHQVMARVRIEAELSVIRVTATPEDPNDYAELLAAMDVMAQLRSADARIIANVLAVWPEGLGGERLTYFAGYLAGSMRDRSEGSVTFLLYPADIGVFELDTDGLEAEEAEEGRDPGDSDLREGPDDMALRKQPDDTSGRTASDDSAASTVPETDCMKEGASVYAALDGEAGNA